jgi:hypothetical protein
LCPFLTKERGAFVEIEENPSSSFTKIESDSLLSAHSGHKQKVGYHGETKIATEKFQ